MNNIDLLVDDFWREIDTFTVSEIKEHIYEKLKTVPLETKENMNAFFKNFPFWGTFDNDENNLIKQVSSFLKDNVVSLKEFYQSLGDYRSKKVFYAIVNNWYNYDFLTLEEVSDKTFTHYFDLDIIPSCQEEVFVDLGAYTGDSIMDFIKTFGRDSYQKIYAYEMTSDSITFLKDNLQKYPAIIYREKAIADFVGKGKIILNQISSSANQIKEAENGLLEVTTLDEDIKEKITFLKMDIEAGEYAALKGATKHICEDSPKLAISIYHGFTDFIRIWQYISAINHEYNYYLRYYGGPIFPTEIVLYAIPAKVFKN